MLQDNSTKKKQGRPFGTFKYGALQTRCNISLPSLMLDQVKKHNLNLSQFVYESLTKHFKKVKPVKVSEPTLKVFVYGTLKQGFPNHHLLMEHYAKFISTDTLTGYCMYSAGTFPFITKNLKNLTQIVHGEVYEVSKSCLQALDKLEAFDLTDTKGSLYLRVPITTNNLVSCYTYVGNNFEPIYPIVKSGNWEQK